VKALQAAHEHALTCTATVDPAGFGPHSAHAGQKRPLDAPAEVERPALFGRPLSRRSHDVRLSIRTPKCQKPQTGEPDSAAKARFPVHHRSFLDRFTLGALLQGCTHGIRVYLRCE
jgi:hypothetical protein